MFALSGNGSSVLLEWNIFVDLSSKMRGQTFQILTRDVIRCQKGYSEDVVKIQIRITEENRLTEVLHDYHEAS
jgi:hypothetical protein